MRLFRDLRQRKFRLWAVLERRLGWFVENTSVRQAGNMVQSFIGLALHRKVLKSFPVVLKIDISPLCNLRCQMCVHANSESNALLNEQVFNSQQRMSLEGFRAIVNEAKGKTAALSLYYLGDPLTHPNLDEMCEIASDAGINTHVSSNFSFGLSDDRILSIVTSGLTHLTIYVDGMSQEKYELTRLGGRIDKVKSNLERICEVKQRLGYQYPKIEVQYIKYQHNVDELNQAIEYFNKIGVNQVVTFWGAVHNLTELDPIKYNVFQPKKRQVFPQCFWPYFSMLIKYNGDVIPCCSHRQGTQYISAEGDSSYTFGNIFDSSIEQIWNSEYYRHAREIVSNPIKVEAKKLEEHFCNSCHKVSYTDKHKQIRLANENIVPSKI